MTIFELAAVYIWILWLAYRWWIMPAILGLAWYYNQDSFNALTE